MVPSEQTLDQLFELCSAGKGNEVAEIVARHHIDINQPLASRQDCTPLHIAAGFGRLGVVEILISLGADGSCQDAKGFVALHNAAAFGHLDVVKALLRHKPSTIRARNCHGDTPLHLAACSGHTDICFQLLRRGADPLTLNGADKSALDIAKGDAKLVLSKDYKAKEISEAARTGQLAVLESCVNHYNVNYFDASDPSAVPPLHLAAGYCHRAVVHFLLERGADANLQDTQGRTALHSAAAHGHEAIVVLLVSSLADVNIQDNWGFTPLHEAAEHSRDRVVQLLRQQGAKSLKNNEGKLPVDLATSASTKACLTAPVMPIQNLGAPAGTSGSGAVMPVGAKTKQPRRSPGRWQSPSMVGPASDTRSRSISLPNALGSKAPATRRGSRHRRYDSSSGEIVTSARTLGTHHEQDQRSSSHTREEDSGTFMSTVLDRPDVAHGVPMQYRGRTSYDTHANPWHSMQLPSPSGSTSASTTTSVSVSASDSIWGPATTPGRGHSLSFTAAMPQNLSAAEGRRRRSHSGNASLHTLSSTTSALHHSSSSHLPSTTSIFDDFSRLPDTLYSVSDSPMFLTRPRANGFVEAPTTTATTFDSTSTGTASAVMSSPHRSTMFGSSDELFSSFPSLGSLSLDGGTSSAYPTCSAPEDGKLCVKCCQAGDIAAVERILHKSPSVVHFADPSTKSTPLHVAAGYNHVDLVAFLLEHGADVNRPDASGFVPLHNAASFNHLDLVKLLLQQPGVQANAPDNWGYTPLHEAARKNHVNVAKLLLDHGANTSLKTTDTHQTALDLAPESSDVHLLLSTMHIVT
eukprot:m.59061 g.59061  ORF g.59061 m.59061 type:complete len:805 (+) comp11745_c0_seq2:377-2791(+)